MRVKMPRIMSPFMPAPEIIGHSGSSGSFAFYCPSKQVYIVGTLNQTEKKSIPNHLYDAELRRINH